MISYIRDSGDSKTYLIGGSIDFSIGSDYYMGRGSALFSRLSLDRIYEARRKKLEAGLPKINTARLIAEYLSFLYQEFFPAPRRPVKTWSFIERIMDDYSKRGEYPVSLEGDLSCINRHLERLSRR